MAFYFNYIMRYYVYVNVKPAGYIAIYFKLAATSSSTSHALQNVAELTFLTFKA